MGLKQLNTFRSQTKSPLKDIPIIAITAHNMEEYSTSLYEAGFSEALAKPYTFEKLAEILKKYIPSINTKECL